MKTKEHEFIVTVRTPTKRSALTAVLSSFASRKPDGCEFTVMDHAAYLRRQHKRMMKMCAETRKRMNGYTPEQRAALDADVRKKFIACLRETVAATP